MIENELPNDVYRLKQMLLQRDKLILEFESKLLEKDQKILNLQDLVNLLQRRKFAPQSEVVSSEQSGLFNEIEDLINTPPVEDEEDDAETEEAADKPKKKRRPRLPVNLPREEVILDLDEKDKVCIHDGHQLKKNWRRSL